MSSVVPAFFSNFMGFSYSTYRIAAGFTYSLVKVVETNKEVHSMIWI